MALMSGKVYSNTGAPSNADGVNGDIYMQLDGFKTTYRKEGGSWVAVGSTLGAIPEFISGVGVPSNVLGEDGQYYRNSANQDMYYKQGGLWANVGNLAGIGKDLATPPNFINSGSLNTVIEPGEYFYTNTVTNTPAPYGLMKVWRENATYIYQLVQAAGSGGRLFNRYSGDGGATWGSWVEYANSGGSSSQVFKVADADDDDEAVNKGQLETKIMDTVLGHSQAWYDMEYARSLGTTYINTSNKPIVVSVGFTMTGSPSGFQYTWWDFKVENITVARAHMAFDSGGIVSRDGNISVIVPPQQTYRLNRSGAAESIIDYWTELR